jgi:hypothetical protein
VVSVGKAHTLDSPQSELWAEVADGASSAGRLLMA